MSRPFGPENPLGDETTSFPELHRASPPPPFEEARNGKVTTYSCSICRFTWGWTAREIGHRIHDAVLDKHMAEHAAVVVVGRHSR